MQGTQETRIWSWVGKIPWSRKRQPTPVLLPEKHHRPEPGGLQFMGSQNIGLDWSSWTHEAAHLYDLHHSPEKHYCITSNRMSTLQMRKMRHREVKRFVHHYLASKCQSQIVNPPIWLQNLWTEPLTFTCKVMCFVWVNVLSVLVALTEYCRGSGL